MILFLMACGLFSNQPPELISFNGVIPDENFYFDAFRFTPEEDIPIELEFKDPEGREVEVWWPYASVEIEFDPRGTTGVIKNPPAQYIDFTLLLMDTDRQDPKGADFWISFVPEGDTGYIVYEE